MGIIQLIRDRNKPGMPKAEYDAYMAKVIADYDATVKAREKWENDPRNYDYDDERERHDPLLDGIVAVAVGTAIGKRL